MCIYKQTHTNKKHHRHMLMLKRADDIILHEGLGSIPGTKGANSKIDSLRELGLCVCACVSFVVMCHCFWNVWGLRSEELVRRPALLNGKTDSPQCRSYPRLSERTDSWLLPHKQLYCDFLSSQHSLPVFSQLPCRSHPYCVFPHW